MQGITEADVIVIGGGGAGLAAASEARRSGAHVILLEKNPQTGGSTSWSVGSVTAINTPHQKKLGISDSADAHFEDIGVHDGVYAPRDNLALRRILVDNTTEMFDWLLERGIVFIGPMLDPPQRVARMHNVVPNARSFAYHLTRYCRVLGVDIRLNTTSERLLEENGRVIGVEARLPDGALHRFHARGGVVLAAGDYSAGRDLKARFASPEAAEVDPVNETATGDGQRMALELGAVVVNGDIMRGPVMRFIPPTRPGLIHKLPPYTLLARFMAWSADHLPQWLLRPFFMSFLTTALGPAANLYKQGAVLINKRGERFTDELGDPNHAVVKQPERIAWIVFDHEIARKFTGWPHFISTAPGIAYAYLGDYRRNRGDIYHQAPTWAGLAASMGVPAEALAHSIAEYNGAGRETRPALQRAPYYALGPVKSYVVFTDGGLKVTEKHEVVREDGSVIRGLYAAGSTGQGGQILEGHGHHLGWAFISGRFAGRNAAQAAAAK